MKDYKKIDSQLFQISRKINLLAHLRPKNLKQEKEKFLDSKSYNPQFRYRPANLDFSQLKKTLHSITIDQTPLGIIFNKKRKGLLKISDIIQGIGTGQFTRKSQALYRKPTLHLIKKAKTLLETLCCQEKEKISASKAKENFKKRLMWYGLDHWEVRLSENLVPDCYTGASRIFIARDIKFSKTWLKKTIIHEIDTHVLRRENGKFQPYFIFRYGLAGNTLTEEGLAVYNEQTYVSEKSAKDSLWALYVLACDVTLSSSFREVFNMARDYGLSKDRAWIVACKVKRGLADTSKPGGFMKDWCYLAGKYKLEDYVKKGGNLRKLYLGKIGIEDLPLVEKIPNIKKPKYLPKFLTN